MRAFVILCFAVSAVTAQYQYGLQANGAADYESETNNAATAAAHAPALTTNEYNKEFFSYSAPEEEFNDAGASERIAEAVRKNLRVVFIKGPENHGLENAVLQLANTAAEQRTQIYVLTKQTDIAELAGKLNDLKQQNSRKPEVHFVKYRTPADAERAQQVIQQQYDSLPGATVGNTNGGVANVLDFSSASPRAIETEVNADAEQQQRQHESRTSSVVRDAATRNSLRKAYNSAQAAYLPPGRRF